MLRRVAALAIGVGAAVAVAAGCTQKVSPPTGPIDMGPKRVPDSVQVVFTANCVFSGCHGGSAPRAGMDLSAEHSYDAIVDVASIACAPLARVRPGKPDSSCLVKRITGEVAPRMPLTGDPLPDADQRVITNWIREGALPAAPPALAGRDRPRRTTAAWGALLAVLSPRAALANGTPDSLAVAAAMLAAADSVALAKGRPLFKKYCETCHGPKGGGDGPAAKGLKPRPRNFRNPAELKSKNDQEVERVIRKGGASLGLSPVMVAWGGVLKDKEIAALVAFVRAIGREAAREQQKGGK